MNKPNIYQNQSQQLLHLFKVEDSGYEHKIPSFGNLLANELTNPY